MITMSMVILPFTFLIDHSKLSWPKLHPIKSRTLGDDSELLGILYVCFIQLLKLPLKYLKEKHSFFNWESLQVYNKPPT